MKAGFALTIFVLLLFLSACSQSGLTKNAIQNQKRGACVDSDGGKNTETFGIAKVTDSGGRTYEIRDQCVGNIYLIEAYCDGNLAKTENFVCQDFCDPFENVCF